MKYPSLLLDPEDPAALLRAVAGVPGATELLGAVEEVSEPVYLVGGAVRDLLLGSGPRELDVVVEGEPTALLEQLGGTARNHERFGTAAVELPGGATIDIAMARAERYPQPGSLPEVEPAPLAIDLHRRDVTLNAIALDLRSGALVYDGTALEDLNKAVLRVLHPGSFVDDPTRLWRLARYEVRLGADWDPITALLARAAIDGGAVDTVSPERMASELRLALREPDPYGALAAAQRLGLGPRLELDALRLEQAERLGAGLADPADLVLAAVASDDPLLTRYLERRPELNVIEATLLLRSTGGQGRRPGQLAAQVPGSQIRARFEGLPYAAVAAAPDAGAAERWLRDLRHVELQVDGSDLLAAGIPAGPALGRGLGAALAAVLDERIGRDDRAAQLAEAKRHAC